MGILTAVPKQRLFQIWEIFTSIDTDSDLQVDAAEVKCFFYHLGAASEDPRCRAAIAAQFNHPNSEGRAFAAQDFVDALSQEPTDTLKRSGWVRCFGPVFPLQDATGSQSSATKGSVQPMSEAKDIYDEPEQRLLTSGFWQFAGCPLCRPSGESTDLGPVDLVDEFRLVALKQRWGRFSSWKLAAAVERFRQYNAAWQGLGLSFCGLGFASQNGLGFRGQVSGLRVVEGSGFGVSGSVVSRE